MHSKKKKMKFAWAWNEQEYGPRLPPWNVSRLSLLKQDPFGWLWSAVDAETKILMDDCCSSRKHLGLEKNFEFEIDTLTYGWEGKDDSIFGMIKGALCLVWPSQSIWFNAQLKLRFLVFCSKGDDIGILRDLRRWLAFKVDYFSFQV